MFNILNELGDSPGAALLTPALLPISQLNCFQKLAMLFRCNIEILVNRGDQNIVPALCKRDCIGPHKSSLYIVCFSSYKHILVECSAVI